MKKENPRLKPGDCLHPSLEGVSTPSKEDVKDPGLKARVSTFWMKKNHAIVRDILDDLFPNPRPPLNHKDPFTLLIAVLLSAVCSDERVNAVTPALFALASTPQTMARLSIETIQKTIKPCGLSLRKATAIKELSEELVRRGGSVPQTLQELESLPGVGHKTASVVLAQAFGIPAFPVDRHIFRSARRWGLSTGSSIKAVEKDLKKLFPRKEWAQRHLQIILYARQYCRAVRHTTCPICAAIDRNSLSPDLRSSSARLGRKERNGGAGRRSPGQAAGKARKE